MSGLLAAFGGLVCLANFSPVPDGATGVAVQVRCEDGSTLNVELLESEIELLTKYGTLKIAVADIRQIQFATRTPPEVAAKVDAAIENLSHPDFEVRESATKELKSLRGRAYFAAMKATKRNDPEVSRRASDVCDHIRLKAGAVEFIESDVVVTVDSKFSGKFAIESLRIRTALFGEQRIKLADIITLGTSPIVAEATEVAPPNMNGKEIGREYTFVIVGAVPGAANTGLWGSGTYTLDSSLSAAAVHAGLVQPGKPATLRVRVVTSPPGFIGTTANGFTSASFAGFPAGAFEFVK